MTESPLLPQLYVGEKLFGGYEKIVEMTCTGEFPDALETLGVEINDKGNIRLMP